MKQIPLVLLMFVLSQAAFSQSNIYKHKYQIDSILKNDKNSFKFQIEACDYSMIGEYKLDLETNDHFRTLDAVVAVPSAKQKEFAGYKPIKAIPYIIEQAKKTRLIIINEAHHHPDHRVFVSDLLPQLKKIGYNYIGFEALDYKDTAINTRKYPIIQDWNYPDEPCFGELLRTSLLLNYTAFPYEAKLGTNGKERETQEANNIESIIRKNPQAKFIIYCGYDHAIEDSTKNAWGLAMAGRLKKNTGIDPLTIDQVQLTENSNVDFDNPYRRLINLPYSAVFINNEGHAFNKAFETKTFDINVYHPNTQYINGRPNWLKNKTNRYLNITNKVTIDFPCLVYAYNFNEDITKAVPVDIIELNNNSDFKYLVLSKGKKTLKITNVKGQIQMLKIR